MKIKFRKPVVILYSSIFMLSIIFLFVSCNNASNAYYSPDKLVIYDRTESLDTIKGVFIDSISGPLGIECLDDYLVILGSTDGALFTVVDTKKDTIVKRFGNFGHAKTELLNPINTCQFYYNPSNEVNMCIDDIAKHELHLYDFGEVIKTGKLAVRKKLHYEIDNMRIPSYHSYFLEEDSYMVREGVSSEGDYRDISTLPPCTKLYFGDNIKTCTAFPSIIESDDPQHLLRTYEMITRIKPDRTKFVEFFTYMNLFTIYDVKTQKSIGVIGDTNCFENMKSIGKLNKKEQFDNILLHNFCSNASDKYIMVCQDGKTSLSDIDDITDYTPLLRIFDWNGKLLQSCRIKESITRIAISDSSQKFYGIDSNFKLYSYDLSKMPLDK